MQLVHWVNLTSGLHAISYQLTTPVALQQLAMWIKDLSDKLALAYRKT